MIHKFHVIFSSPNKAALRIKRLPLRKQQAIQEHHHFFKLSRNTYFKTIEILDDYWKIPIIIIHENEFKSINSNEKERKKSIPAFDFLSWHRHAPWPRNTI